MSRHWQPALLATAGRAVVTTEERDRWEARFGPCEWVAPHDTAAGPLPDWPPLRAGDSHPFGYRCPDPDCGRVEWGAWQLLVGHGFNPLVVGEQPWHGRCRLVAGGGLPPRDSTWWVERDLTDSRPGLTRVSPHTCPRPAGPTTPPATQETP